MIMHAGGKQIAMYMIDVVLVLFCNHNHILYSSICSSIKCIPNNKQKDEIGSR